jgi:hypothetical protein
MSKRKVTLVADGGSSLGVAGIRLARGGQQTGNDASPRNRRVVSNESSAITPIAAPGPSRARVCRSRLRVASRLCD